MSEPIEDRLRRSAPTVQCDHCEPVVHAMLDEVTATGGRPSWLSRHKLAAAAAVAAVFLPGAAFAAAVQFAAQTGEYGAPGMTETDTSQFIDMCAADIDSYMASVAPMDLPLPAGTSWDEFAAIALRSTQQDCTPAGFGISWQETTMAVEYISRAECAWAAAFVDAAAAGSTEDMRRAAKGLTRVEEALVKLGVDSSAEQKRDLAASADAAWIAERHARCQPETSPEATETAPR